MAEKDETQGTPAPAAAAPAPAPTPAPADEPADGGFADAFAELQVAANQGPTPTPAPTPAPAASPAPAAAGVTGGASDVSTGSEANPAAAPTGTPAPAPSPAPGAPDGFVSQADVERIIAERLAAHKPEPSPAPAPTPAPAPAPLYTADEQAALTKYQQDWPDIANGEALQRRAEYGRLVEHVFGQLAPLIDAVNALQTRVPALESTTQYSQLIDAIPDYDAVRDPVIEWVGKQPDYLKVAYEKVTSEGTPDQIADLVSRFKKETGWTAPVAAGTPAPTPSPAPAAGTPAVSGTPAPVAAPAPATNGALPAAAAAAAASLKPVKTGRTEPTQAQDPNDFDGAWAEFAKAS